MSIDAFSVRSTIEALGPKRPEIAGPIKIDSLHLGRLWLARPYIHEYSLAYLYFGIEERQRRFTEKDRDEYYKVFAWLIGFNEKSFPILERIPGRPGPLFLGFNERGIVTSIFNYLSDENFFQRPQYQDFLIGGLDYFTRSLAAEKILAPDYDVFHSQQGTPV